MRTKEQLVREVSFSFLKEFVVETGVIRFGAPNSTREDFVRGVSSNLLKEECEFLNKAYTNRLNPSDAADLFNTHYRPGEDIVRSKFMQYLEPHLDEDEAVFFEHPIGSNRSDINRFNGQSYTYELKSPRDSTKRISDQLKSYSKSIEYIFLVLPESISEPPDSDDSVGLIQYDYPSFQFREIRLPSKQEQLEPEFQLSQLRLTELKKVAGCLDPDGEYRDEKRANLVHQILDQESEEQINSIYKNTLKNRHIGST